MNILDALVTVRAEEPRKRRTHSAACKAKVALAAVKGERTLASQILFNKMRHRSRARHAGTSRPPIKPT
ncbi:hypothetical protein E2R28_25520 [Burkholderia pseudomallei]|uniref:hypothetical protein n=1 Tax=Burkholderia pseudomallei TaxID=28450 RepID=UPI0010660CF6|nr:hypothetical protein [Burkholderia pseudomallei]QBP51504.1 hypothetical protein E2R28_25520 [Burkholderia pseudomallei]